MKKYLMQFKTDYTNVMIFENKEKGKNLKTKNNIR